MKWISVDQKLPARGEVVLVFCPAPSKNKGVFYKYHQHIRVEEAIGDPKKCSGWRRHNRSEISHWMPLPDYPQVKELK